MVDAENSDPMIREVTKEQQRAINAKFIADMLEVLEQGYVVNFCLLYNAKGRMLIASNMSPELLHQLGDNVKQNEEGDSDA